MSEILILPKFWFYIWTSPKSNVGIILYIDYNQNNEI